jgi:hypothetical protein
MRRLRGCAQSRRCSRKTRTITLRPLALSTNRVWSLITRPRSEGERSEALRSSIGATGTMTYSALLACAAEKEERGKRKEGRGKREEGRGKREEGRGKREEGRGKREEGRGKREEGRGNPLVIGVMSQSLVSRQTGGARSRSLSPRRSIRRAGRIAAVAALTNCEQLRVSTVFMAIMFVQHGSRHRNSGNAT